MNENNVDFICVKELTLNSLLSLIRSCARTTSPAFGRPSSAILSCSVKSSGALASASAIAFANSSSVDVGASACVTKPEEKPKQTN